MDEEADLVEIHRGTGSPAMAKLIEDALEAEDVRCLIKTDSGISAAPLGMVPPTFTVLVRRKDAHRAARILEHAEHLSDSNEEVRKSEYANLRRAIRPQSRPSPAPLPVIGSIAVLILGAGLFDLFQGGGLWVLLLPLSAFAFIVALRSHR